MMADDTCLKCGQLFPAAPHQITSGFYTHQFESREKFYTCAACGQDLRGAAAADCGNPWSHDIDVRPTAARDNASHRPTTTAGAAGLGDDYPQAHPRQGVGTITASSQDTIALIAAALLVNHTDDHNQHLGHYTQHVHTDEQCTLCRLLRRMALVNLAGV